MTTVKLNTWARPLFDPYRYKVLYGGRGSGKSYAMADALLILGARQKERILCAREFQSSIKDSVHSLLAERIQALGLGDFYEVQERTIKGLNGTEFIFKGIARNVESIKSTFGVTRCWIEEGQSISESSMRVLVPTIREPGSEIWITFNPGSPEDPVSKRFIEQQPPESAYVRKVNHDENVYFSDVLKDEMERDRARDPDKYSHVWLGQYRTASEARIFRNWTVRDFEAPEGTHFYFGADWGFSIDPTTLVRFFLDGLTLYIDYEAYQVGCDIMDTPRLFDTVPESRRWVIVADNARPETINHMKRAGFRMMASRKGKGSVEDGIEFLKGFGIVVHPRCKRAIEAFSIYSYKVDIKSETVTPLIDHAGSDLIDALRYGSERVRLKSKRMPHAGNVQTANIDSLRLPQIGV